MNSIGIDINNTAEATANIQNLKLVDDSTGTQIGNTIGSPSSATTVSTSVTAGLNTFSTNFTLNASATKTIDVYADVPSSLVGSRAVVTAYVDHTATNATGATTGTTATIGTSNVQLQNITVNTGSLTVALGASDPVAANVVGRLNNVEVADYTFSANTSSYTVKNLNRNPAASSTAVSGVSTSATRM